ncbi:MAG: hypothetical protein ACI9LU_002310 [Polaribacter sp.]|jgi:hypothetical protein
MKQTSLNKFSYWNEALLTGQLPKPLANRYVVFDVDQGGLNNIRMAFDYVVVLTALTGRTLVMPVKSPWYLLDIGPIPDEHKGGATEFDDIYNIQALAKAIPVISTEEFIQIASSHLEIPKEFQNSEAFNGENNGAWRDWLLESAEIPGWNPYDTVICMPNIKAAMVGPHMDDAYLDGRTPVEFSAWMNAAPVLYFPSTKKYRSLGPVATMLAGSDDTNPILARRLLKHHIRYSDEIFGLANKIINALGLDYYDSIQIRGNDFQYTKSMPGIEAICDNIGALFDESLPIYVASDETKDCVFDELAAKLRCPKIFRWEDAESVVKEPIPFAWIGPLEQLICAGARRFVGTDLSTFTSYIHRLRGYMQSKDQNLYFHNRHYSSVPKPTTADDFRGRNYLKENPLFWLSC